MPPKGSASSSKASKVEPKPDPKKYESGTDDEATESHEKIQPKSKPRSKKVSETEIPDHNEIVSSNDEVLTNILDLNKKFDDVMKIMNDVIIRVPHPSSTTDKTAATKKPTEIKVCTNMVNGIVCGIEYKGRFKSCEVHRKSKGKKVSEGGISERLGSSSSTSPHETVNSKKPKTQMKDPELKATSTGHMKNTDGKKSKVLDSVVTPVEAGEVGEAESETTTEAVAEELPKTTAKSRAKAAAKPKKEVAKPVSEPEVVAETKIVTETTTEIEADETSETDEADNVPEEVESESSEAEEDAEAEE